MIDWFSEMVHPFGILALVLLSFQQKGADIPLEAPKGWGGETIVLPPKFAPGMKLKGSEKIRFAPGMFKPEAEDWWISAPRA